jgi:hypothetical protein
MSTYQISCTVRTTDPTAALGLEIWLDNHVLFDAAHITHETLPLIFDIADDEAEHELRFVMKGKTSEDTVVDEHGNIVKDATLTIDDIAFDEIELNHIVFNNAVYTHDFNNTKDSIQDKFYGTMGCNGTVSLKFNTPVYLWLLENM